jgi:hypothetical protein
MDTLEAPRVVPASAPLPGAEALFKEAQRHRRNRRLRRSGIVAVLLSLAVLFGLVVAGHGSRPLPVIPLAQPAFANAVISATTSARGASFTFTDQFPQGACGSGGPRETLRYQGSIDFVRRTMQYSTVDPACPGYPVPLTILSPTATYRHTGSTNNPGITTTAARPWLEFPSSVRSPNFSVADVMVNPEIGALLRGLTGPLTRGPSAMVGDASSREYRGTTTLAALEQSDPAFVKIQPESALPDAASIDVPFEVWVDSQGRVTRVTASEPLFSAVYANGYTEGSGPQVSAFGIPEPMVTGPHKMGVARLSLTFGNFGRKAIAIPPAHAIVKTG